MKNFIFTLAAVGLMVPQFSIPYAAAAQTVEEQELDSELDHLYDQIQVESAPKARKASRSQRVAVSEVADADGNVGQPIVINNQASSLASQGQTQAQVQKQPTTIIESSPIVDSPAEAIRKRRQEVELQTEMKIVEKLETSRMEDEKRRADVLFGDKFSQLNQQQAVQQAPVVTVPQEAVAPISTSNVRDEVRAALDDLKSIEEKPASKTYMGAILGMVEYPDVINVKSNYAVGALVGMQLKERLLFDGSFVFSNYQVQKVFGAVSPYYPEYTDVDQYNVSGTLKFQMGSGALRPVIGGVVSYNYRSYTDTQYTFFANSAKSHAVDVGLMTGADLELMDDLTLGLDFRYMWNLTNRVDGDQMQSMFLPQQQASYGTPVEELNYYLLSIVGRMTF